MDIESSKRGLWNASSMTVKEFNVPRDDFIVGLEYMYEGFFIFSIRFVLFHGGVTKWIGAKKKSLSILTLKLHVDMCPRLKFENERDKLLCFFIFIFYILFVLV
jgi:hypothetical protein